MTFWTTRVVFIVYVVGYLLKLILFVQVLGHKEGLSVMERADPLFLLIGLPMVPVSLILSKMIRWEDFILRLWRKHCTKLPLISYFFQPGMWIVEQFVFQLLSVAYEGCTEYSICICFGAE